jgi:hypothetical protein
MNNHRIYGNGGADHRAEVHADGSVSIISDISAMRISIVNPSNPVVQSLPLSEGEAQALYQQSQTNHLFLDPKTRRISHKPKPIVS